MLPFSLFPMLFLALVYPPLHRQFHPSPPIPPTLDGLDTFDSHFAFRICIYVKMVNKILSVHAFSIHRIGQMLVLYVPRHFPEDHHFQMLKRPPTIVPRAQWMICHNQTYSRSVQEKKKCVYSKQRTYKNTNATKIMPFE